MHELAIVNQVIQTSADYMEKNDGKEVKEIYLHIGALNMVVEPLLNQAFDCARKDTPCENADLFVSFLPIKFKCEDCGEVFQVDADKMYTTPCPKCGQKNIKFVSGNEFFIDYIKIT